jgi:hypothetical protein
MYSIRVDFLSCLGASILSSQRRTVSKVLMPTAIISLLRQEGLYISYDCRVGKQFTKEIQDELHVSDTQSMSGLNKIGYLPPLLMPVVESRAAIQTKACWLQVSKQEVGLFWRPKREVLVRYDSVLVTRVYPYVTFVFSPDIFIYLKPENYLNNILTFFTPHRKSASSLQGPIGLGK